MREDVATKWAQVIKQVMEHPKLLGDFGIKLEVPIVVEVKVASHWAEPAKKEEEDG